MLETIFTALILTIIAEALMGGFVGVMSKRFIVCAVIINIITNPILNLILYFIENPPLFTMTMIILEIIVFYIEGLFYQKCLKSYHHPFLLSLILNLTSLFAWVLASIML